MPVYFLGEDERDVPRSRSAWRRISKRANATSRPATLSNCRLLGWIDTADAFQLERHLHQHFGVAHVRGEWFAIEPADVLPILMRAGRDGFVAKNADAFQITGYDRDAVPEYLGVWEWANLEIDECCPFCGCLCGMHFQDASQMYHCIRCDTLTDFSEFYPRREEPDC